MFSPSTKKLNFSSRKDLTAGRGPPDTPITPLAENRRFVHDNSVPNRPSTGTPAPWASRLSVLARIPSAKKNEKGDDCDPIRPVFVGEFPQVVRDEQAVSLQKHVPGDAGVSGGMDKEASLAWIICRDKLFIWSYLLPVGSRKCVDLCLPSSILGSGDTTTNSGPNNWLLRVVNWDLKHKNVKEIVPQCNSAGILLCNLKSRALAYWPDIYSQGVNSPVTSFASTDELEATFSLSDGKSTPNKQLHHSRRKSVWAESLSFNSLIASAISGGSYVCIALACSSNGELWQFHCSPSGIRRKRTYQDIANISHEASDGRQGHLSKGYPKSLVWHFPRDSLDLPKRRFLLLTDHEIQCFSINLSPDFCVSKLWSHEIIGADGDSGIQKGLAGQKRIWPLDLQIDDQGKVITVLIATFCKDRVSSSSYTEYSLLTMQYRSGVSISSEAIELTHERVLEKKAPIQVIIPKARVEEEDFLFCMRLRVGGKPPGSAIIISGDGTATVSHYWRNSTRLYQFDLPYDAGKVLDASVFPGSDDGEDGAWAVLTEKAGVWAIPEKAVLLGGVEPPERSLSRKGSSNEGSEEKERRDFSFTSNVAPRRATSEAWDAGDRQRAAFTVIARQSVRDEESEALVNHLFHDFLLSGQIDGVMDKLNKSGAFEREGETNVFARISKSIVDTLAKHWTTTRGAEIVALAVVSTQLMEKQQKHKKFLQFLALSKCHEELCSRQRQSLQIIMEHAEKLAAMIHLRELQNMMSQNRSNVVGSPYAGSETDISGALWDLIQLVGERARRTTVLLMDRDNAEVFYSKVSDLEELFYCLEKNLDYIITVDMPLAVQFQRVCELSNACVNVLRTAMEYRNEHHMWYPSPEGLTPWYCKNMVRNGLWSIASFMLQLSNETYSLGNSAKLEFHSNLEALAEVLLESHSGAITAQIERGEEHKGLLSEFWNRRDAVLDSLYQQVKDLVQAMHQDSSEGIGEQNEEIIRKLSSSLLSLAKRHEGYKTMWNMSCDLNDSDLLRNLMRDSMGPKGGFSIFVYQQLYNNKQFSKLMRLGEEFPEELAAFLKHHPDLLWLHELFLHQFSAASGTLHDLALSQDGSSSISATEGTDSSDTNAKVTLADRKRFLNLAKIAAVAGKSSDFEMKVKRIEADLKILKLQEEILQLLPDDEEKEKMGKNLLPPLDLIELCIKSQYQDLSLRAFHVFAWTSSSFLRSNTSLLEDCWRNAANQDDWEKLYQTSIVEGWSDEETLQVLRETVLFQASSWCYGPESNTFEGQFDEVLPLRQENMEFQTLKDMDSSVEAILMQHKDFADAGKLMLTAIMLGSDQGMIEEGPSPME